MENFRFIKRFIINSKTSILKLNVIKINIRFANYANRKFEEMNFEIKKNNKIVTRVYLTEIADQT